MKHGRLRNGLPVVVVAALVAAAACGSLPVSPGVHRVRAVAANAQQDTNVRLIPPPPQPGDGPTGIVAGFLRAAASDVERARQFLVANASWSSDAPIRVYNEAALAPKLVKTTPATAEHVPASTVAVRMTPVATLDPSGALVPTAGSPLTLTFTLAELPGVGWRITAPPPGIALSVSDLTSRAQIPLTFFAPTGDVTVRTPVLLDPGADLLTTAVDALLSAQPSGLRTYVPAGTALNDVSISSSTIVVDLTPSAARVSPTDLPKLGAQLAATLLPLEPDATGVRIDVSGRPLEGSDRYTSSDVDQYDAELATATDGPVVVTTSGARLAAAPSAGPADGGEPTAVAFSDDGHRVAWVRSRRVVVAPVSALGTATAVTGTGSWRSLSWGRDGSLWLVRDDGDAGGNVSVLAPGASVPVPAALPPGLAGLVTELRIARDGVDATLVAGGVLSDATIGEEATGPVLRDVVPLARGLTQVAVVTARGGDGALLAYGTFQRQRGLWHVATEISAELLTDPFVVTAVRAPCMGSSAPTALAQPGGGNGSDLAVCDGRLRLRQVDGSWSDAGPADGAAWPGG